MICVFDILLCNDQILANKPLRYRRQVLQNVFNPVEGRLMLSQVTEKQTRLVKVSFLDLLILDFVCIAEQYVRWNSKGKNYKIRWKTDVMWRKELLTQDFDPGHIVRGSLTEKAMSVHIEMKIRNSCIRAKALRKLGLKNLLRDEKNYWKPW